MNALNGIDVLERNGCSILEGHRIGLITNHTGLTRNLKPTVDFLVSQKNLTVTKLFGPEHGIRGELDDIVPDSTDAKTGLPVLSLYGKHRKPTPEMMDGLDMLVYDIQDIGCRFYTYISTLGLAIEAAAEAGVPIVVLDRVNPIGAVEVAGPIADAGKLSFVAHHPIPVQHGMTVGELASLFNGEKELGATLIVVKCEKWRRAEMFDSTGLYWVNPSPNMRSLTQAMLYPGIGLLEFTNLSVGRGTDTPFELVGAPWMNGRKVADELNLRRLPGVAFVPTQFKPTFREFKGELCDGVNIIVTDRDAFMSVRTGLHFSTALQKLYPTEWLSAKYQTLLVNSTAYQGLVSGRSAEEIERMSEEELARFVAIREKYLLYE